MEGSLFDVHRAEPSQQLMGETPQLDMKQAESSQQHVRALNTQFASWVQTQLKNHPDELWEDGVRDYLDHATSIMEKFSDVVNWLKANATKAENSTPGAFAGKKFVSEVTNKENKIFGEKTGSPPVSTATNFATKTENSTSGAGAFFAGNKFMPVVTNNENKIFGEKTGSPPVSTATNFATKTENSTAGAGAFFAGNKFSPEVTNKENKTGSPLASSAANFASPWTPGIFSNNQNPFTFGGNNTSGNQSSAPSNSNHNASDDVDAENEEEQPSSPSVKKSEEKGVVVVHEVKCKLYVKSTDPTDKDVWKDKGMGHLSIKCKEGVAKASKESKPTIIVRNEVGKILLNALLYHGIKTNPQKNSLVAIFHTSGNADGNGGDNDSVVARVNVIHENRSFLVGFTPESVELISSPFVSPLCGSHKLVGRDPLPRGFHGTE
ncbi:RanBP1 domain-containing protein [Trifolium pratense]|uniref:RanBP1 domain-containing protein n=1 Tax=Trifolium pratense TaxID=57577 RepID=A0A2K3P216_TRIPR|nr:RanBP1 domain-containing protein [Trifolium pratense]